MMTTMKRFVTMVGLGLLTVALASGCKTDDSDKSVDRSDMLSANDRVSNVPWNKPQGWETKSQLGSLANDPRIGGGGGTGQ